MDDTNAKKEAKSGLSVEILDGRPALDIRTDARELVLGLSNKQALNLAALLITAAWTCCEDESLFYQMAEAAGLVLEQDDGSSEAN